MSIVIQDEIAIASFSNLSGPDEVRTPDGRLLGRFIPSDSSAMSFPEVCLTDAELDRRLNDPNAVRHTPEQVMARIRELDQYSH